MTDDASNPPKPVKLADLAKLGLPDDTKPINDAAKALADLGPQLNAAHQFRKQIEAQKSMYENLLRPSKEVEALRNRLASFAKPNPAMKSILDQVENQQRLLGSFSAEKALDQRLGAGINEHIPIPRMPDFEIPRNPILDTNAKLADIEQKFESMLDVMANAARIGNDIQAQATTFIDKFEDASAQTDKSAKKAILVGVIALVIATLSPFAPMVVDYFSPNRTVPSIEALTSEVISSRQSANADNQQLIEALKERNDQVAERLLSELRQKQDETNVILRELIQSLKNRTTPTSQ